MGTLLSPPILSLSALQTVVGTDIAELLLRDHRTVWLPGKSPSEANLIDFTNEPVEQVEEEESGEAQLSFLMDSQVAATCTLEKETERFRELLLYGRKKVLCPWSLARHLWLSAVQPFAWMPVSAVRSPAGCIQIRACGLSLTCVSRECRSPAWLSPAEPRDNGAQCTGDS